MQQVITVFLQQLFLSDSWELFNGKKGDIRSYHQAKITTNNVLFTLAGPNLYENIKILVHLFIMSQKNRKITLPLAGETL